jgi:23S rRNA (pseudouridine1915-N3)-methyltransferase
MHFVLLYVGKPKELFIKEGEREYLKKLAPFCKLELIEIKSFGYLKGQSKQAIIVREGSEIIKKINNDSYVIILDKEGKKFVSEDMVKKIDFWLNLGKNIVLVIGGAFGLSVEVKKRAQEILSLSDLTFTHELARIILLEQLYRGFTIKKNVPYHY